MKTIRIALVSIVAACGALVARAQQADVQPFVLTVTGKAIVVLADSNKSIPVVAGQVLPEGSSLTTAADGHVIIQSHDGIKTGIGPDSRVSVGSHSISSDGIRTAVIDLNKGTTVSVLDPSRRAVNNYAVRTPKGVAAARGTTYTTTVTLSSGGEAVVTVHTLTGAVSFAIVGGQSVSVTEGNSASSSTGASVSIADAIAAAPTPQAKQDIADAINAAVTVTATLAYASGQTGDTGAAATLTSVVTSVTAAANEVAASDPALASSIVQSTVVTVRERAGDSAPAAVAAVTNTADHPSVQSAAAAGAAAPVTPVTPPVSSTPDDSQTPAPAPATPGPASTPVNPIDPTITSPSA